MECAVCGDAAQKGTAVQFHQCFRTTGECIGISYFSISSGMCFHRCFVETHSDLTVRISALCAALQPLSNGIRQTVFYCCLHSIHILFMFMLYDKG